MVQVNSKDNRMFNHPNTHFLNCTETQSKNRQKLRQWLDNLDAQDGLRDGCIEHSVWSKYEKTMGIKSAEFSKLVRNPNLEGNCPVLPQKYFGVRVSDVFSQCVKNNKKKYGE
ncbi:hypothetical protein IJ750_04610 [bacterium]|nr:hypothetical protein [bacterium]